MTIDMTFERRIQLVERDAYADGMEKANITAVLNMLKLGVDEAAVKDLYPAEFEEGKKQFEESKIREVAQQ